jgi:mannosyltransferase
MNQQPDTLPRARATIMMFFVLVVATLLRFYKLNEGLWFDEILTAVRYVRLPFSNLLFAFDSENQHILYSILAHVSVSIFGEHSWSLRLPAALFGIGAIWMLYIFGTVVTNRMEALIACALLSVSYFHIWFSQNARGYTGLQFWTIASGVLLIRSVQSGDRNKWLLYGTALALGMYTQLTMLFVAVAHFLIFLFYSKRTWKGFLYGFVGSAVLTLILYAPVLTKMLHTLGEESTVAIWKQPMWTFLEIARGMKEHFAGGVVLLAAAAIFVAGLVSYFRSNPMVVALLLLPVVIGSAVTLGLGHPLWPRFFFFNFGFAVLVLVRGVLALSSLSTMNRLGSVPGTIVCLILIGISAAGVPKAYAPKQDFVAAQNFVEQNRLPGDIVGTVGRISFVYQDFYHLPFRKLDTPRDLRHAMSSGNTWVLYIFPEDIHTLYPQVLSILESDFDLVKTFDGTLNGGTIYVRRSR